MQTAEEKKRETTFIIVLLILLAAILVFAKYALGINVRLLENRYQSIGMTEIRENGAWAVRFTVFGGELENSAELDSDSEHILEIRGNAESGSPVFTLRFDDHEYQYAFTGELTAFAIPAGTEQIQLRVVSDSDAINGFFDVMWGNKADVISSI